ncbi:MAG TPA: DNA alkylation repair protein [Candidatus Acidoferrum sp.]|nr:DNA alkylation repair protein [Candidatus Acidoferrum sp.]
MRAQSPSSLIRTTRSKQRVVGARGKPHWTKATVVRELKSLGDPRVRAKMEYFGVRVPKAHGISAPVLHALAKQIGKNHALALEMWATGIHEARILATLIGESEKVTAAQMERWVRDFNFWDVVDAACCYLYVYANPAWSKASAWSRRSEEFEKRAAFSLMAYLSYKDKVAPDVRFVRFLRVIEREAYDERNFVRKAVNWALRNIGKRNLRLNREAIRAAERIRRQGSRSARWIAADALRELKSPAVQARLHRKPSTRQ